MRPRLRTLLKFLAHLIPRRWYPWCLQCYLRGKYVFLWPFYLGNSFDCPFCDKTFTKLLPGGLDVPVIREKKIVGAGRRNCQCLYCYSGDRERLVYLYLRHKTKLFQEPVKLLHVAPEIMLGRRLRTSSNIDYVSADLQSRLAMVNFDLRDIPYPDGNFDVVICNDVLEHIPDDRKAMAEIYRVLKPRGWAILQTPISLSLEHTLEDPSASTPKKRLRTFGQRDHVRIYAKDYTRRLSAVGFLVDSYDFEAEFGANSARKYGLFPGEQLYVCSKPLNTECLN